MEHKIVSFFNEIFEKYKTVSDDLNTPTPINFEDAKDIISVFVKDQTNILVKSIITGDFIDISDDFPEKLTGLCEEYKSNCKSYIFSDTNLSKFFEQHTDKIFSGVTEILNQFFTLIHQFNITTNHFIYQRQTFIYTNIKGLFELCAYCNLFLLDYSIIDNVSYYEKLSQLENKKDYWHFKEPFSNLKIFEFKLRFLKYKWLKRQKYNNTKLKQFIKETYSEKYVFNNHIIDLDEKIKIGEPYYQVYKEWIEKIEYHYFDDRTEFDFVERSIIKTTNLDTYDLYLRIKLNKDVELNIDELKNLKKLFVQFRIPKFSKNSKEKNILYYYNNLFSAIVANSNENDEKLIDRMFTEVSDLYKNKRNNNFFLYYKYLDYKVKIYNNKIERKKYDEVNIDSIKQILFICKNHFEWCKNGFNRLYDFDKSNSTLIIEGVSVYHASSFSLPLSISENTHIINKLEGEIIKLENNLYQGKNTSYLGDFQEELKKSEKKSIEIISLFTAVISFIVGTVASYQFIKSITQGIIFFIVFGISISIFLMLIFIATRGTKLFEEIKKSWYIFLTPYIFAGIILYLLFNFYKKNESPESATIVNKRIDSISSKNKKLQEEINLIKKDITSQ
ncbi:hypothetical protein [Chryseobacterium sp. EO14]|uniref:hypothetical protein n=1 Tax=Chryseobacterium sp. EO14 TaxID=2950551 RepID=UPI0021093271|nr:hypothetical protein [Chryseobacterium sp. EO14]MCQ4140424.1 hypothetical protein [Chryseobacterium sp. EO14]